MTYDDTDDHTRQCCQDAAIVVYAVSMLGYGMVTHHCYEGTRDCWEKAHAKGYFRLTDSLLIIGAEITDS